ncbi:hypothetical protein HPO96_33300 [Kribbella sandramycini]|uniref:Uncharacterized protein n=1 Tax=Kribbella sandramycini TaxID=60450 RepID=A0A7Y4P2A5_9ACTN|nr:hypothetical protein [Kribbella sandramycini]MBB6566137.1 hypothetical protein [Kribbella sandramycini]NOL45137.1 hypothetical protein [Kribbella sandramycini]
MAIRNRALVAAVAAVAVAAVVGGGLLAGSRGPENRSGAAAAPLAVTTPPASPVATKVLIDATKLPTGRPPQVPYLRGRAVLGGVGGAVRLPGTTPVDAVAKVWSATLAMEVPNATTSNLVIVGDNGTVSKRLPGVDSLVSSADGNSSAFATGGRYTGFDGGLVYFRTSDGTLQTLTHARARDIEVLAVLNRSVFLASRPEDGEVTTLHRWDVDARQATELPKILRPVAVSSDGALAAGLPVLTDSGLCSVVTDIETSRQKWRTCQYRLDTFSPGNAFVIGYPPTAGGPYGETTLSTLDANDGTVSRTWLGPSLRNAVAEDDDHVLIEWHDQAGPQSRSAVVRCTITTGRCELATPLSPEPLLLSS